MITPTVGRVVWIRNRSGSSLSGDQPEQARICFVHHDGLINVAGEDAFCEPFRLLGIELYQGTEADEAKWAAMRGYNVYATWMPYQRGQAAKTEALEAELDKASRAGNA